MKQHLLFFGILLIASSCSNKQYGHLSKVKVEKHLATNSKSITMEKEVIVVLPKSAETYESLSLNEGTSLLINETESSEKNATKAPTPDISEVVSPQEKSVEVPEANENLNQVENKKNKIYNKLIAPLLTKGEGSVDAFALVGFISGAVSLLILPFLFGAIAIIFSAIGFGRIKKNNSKGKGFAIAGLILGIIGVIWALAVLSAV